MEEGKQKLYLKTEALLKFFMGSDDEIDTLIKCRGTEVEMITYDYDLYEALGCITDYNTFDLRKLIKLLEVVDVISYRKNTGKEKPVLKHERVDQLRRLALGSISDKN